MNLWLVIFLDFLVAGAWAFSADDSSYFGMPRLFELDDPARCGALYCLGTFQLRGKGPLMDELKNFSSNSFNFNHTKLHRGWCVSERCPSGGSNGSDSFWFESCVSNSTWQQVGLRAQLYDLKYCRRNETGKSNAGRPIDKLDISFAYTVVGILLINMFGTIYDIFRDEGKKPINFLLAWSVLANWKRFTAGEAAHHDARLNALWPLRGIKALTMLIVLFAHTWLAQFLGYIHNPQFLESSLYQYAVSFHGTVFVQTFVMVASFLLAFNLLLATEKKNVGFRHWPVILLHRLSRIVPVYLFVIGLTATWWERLRGGDAEPLWGPMLAAEAQRCRRKWWTHVLFVNNLVDTDEFCLIQTWFIAVDMQLFVVTSLLLLAMLRHWRSRTALILLSIITLCAVIFNGVFAYAFKLKPIFYYSRPEWIAVLFRGAPSFLWLYAAPWGSLPASLMGLLVAIVLRRLQDSGTQPKDYWWFRVLYRLTVPLTIVLLCLGRPLADVTSRGPLAVLAALDKPVFVIILSIAMIGFFTQVDELWWKFLSWRGFQILSRLSLSVLMLHWNFNLSTIALYTQPYEVGFVITAGNWLCVTLLTYLAALPLTLMLELPMQKFVQAFFDRGHKSKEEELKSKPHSIQP